MRKRRERIYTIPFEETKEDKIHSQIESDRREELFQELFCDIDKE